MKYATAPFLHPKRVGEIDSLCTKCYLTIANAETMEELTAAESAHISGGLKLAKLVHRGQPVTSEEP
jgi:hypothetical protein